MTDLIHIREMARRLPSDYRTMIEEIVPEVLAAFEDGAHDYGDAYSELGVQGQFSDIWRKVIKLKRAVWDGIELEREPIEEVVGDIIRHCIIMLYLRRFGPGDDQHSESDDDVRFSIQTSNVPPPERYRKLLASNKILREELARANAALAEYERDCVDKEPGSASDDLTSDASEGPPEPPDEYERRESGPESARISSPCFYSSAQIDNGLYWLTKRMEEDPKVSPYALFSYLEGRVAS